MPLDCSANSLLHGYWSLYCCIDDWPRKIFLIKKRRLSPHKPPLKTSKMETKLTQTNAKKKRYVVTISLYQYSDDDKRAIAEANAFAMKLNKDSDCRATADSIVEIPFGSTSTRKVL